MFLICMWMMTFECNALTFECNIQSPPLPWSKCKFEKWIMNLLKHWRWLRQLAVDGENFVGFFFSRPFFSGHFSFRSFSNQFLPETFAYCA